MVLLEIKNKEIQKQYVSAIIANAHWCWHLNTNARLQWLY